MIQALLVEFIGTLFFLYVILVTGNPIAIGLALMVSIYIGSKLSGGNFNPAVTIMMVLAKKQKIETLTYVIAQIAGGVAALELYRRLK